MRRALVALALLALGGCTGADFAPASLVTRPRIVGMIARIDADPGRASPLGREMLALEPVVVAPALDDGTLSTAWLACLAAPSRSGAPSCGAAPLGVSPPPVAGVVQPIAFALPELAATPLGAPSVLLTLASCDGGAVPRFAPDGSGESALPTCSGGAEDARAELTFFTLPTALALETANRHPSIADEAFTLAIADGAEATWDVEAPFPTGGCAALAPTASLPHVRVPAGEPPIVTLRWSGGPDDREPYTVTIEGTGETAMRREALQVSHFATNGAFERDFSAVEPDAADDAGGEIEWTPPALETIPAEGEIVRFWWVVRDRRGGMDVAARALCVLPG